MQFSLNKEKMQTSGVFVAVSLWKGKYTTADVYLSIVFIIHMLRYYYYAIGYYFV